MFFYSILACSQIKLSLILAHSISKNNPPATAGGTDIFSWTNQMTVKSDRWIRRMAEDAQLIQPFESSLVREVEGRRTISAGASSYGYDMRLADDGFRVFSPIHGREIDPKHFDDDCLVEPPLRTADDGSKYYLLPDRKSTRLNSSHIQKSRMPSSA